jgi:probable HAF family extracellular repeat protein
MDFRFKLVAISSLLAISAIANADYSITNLSSAIGNDANALVPVGISNSGQIAIRDNLNASFGYLYNNGSVNILPGQPNGISSQGLVVGYGAGGSYIYNNGNLSSIPYLSKGIISLNGINDSGQAVGVGTDQGTGSEQAILYQNGIVTNLGIPTLYANGQPIGYGSNNNPGSTATAINNTGEYIGYAVAPLNGFQVATINNVPILPYGSTANSQALAISNSGDVVGVSYINGHSNAFLDENGVITNLALLPGTTDCTAYGVNDSGSVVGECSGNSFSHAFLYSNGKMIDLSILIATQSVAVTNFNPTGINDSGQIIGNGTVGGYNGAYLLSSTVAAVPVPSALWLFGSALTGFIGLNRRKLA